MTTKRALLVGSSFSAAPIFFALKRRGLDVSVCGNIAADPCHQYADSSYYVDYSNYEDFRSLLSREDFDFLIPSCNDVSYMSCARLASERSFPGFDSTELSTTLHTKNRFRAVTAALKIPSPNHVEIHQDGDLTELKLKPPIIVKPVDSFSGRGMSVVRTLDALPEAIATAKIASRTGAILLEEFIDGTLHSQSAFIQDGRIFFDFFVDEFCTVYPYQVNCSHHPSALSNAVRDGVRGCIDFLVASLGLTNGLLHTQFIARNNDFWIIETMRRSPGDLYGRLVELSTSADYSDNYIRPFLDLRLSPPDSGTPSKFYGRHTVSCSRSAVFFSLSHSIPAVQTSITPLKISGEKFRAAPLDKHAIIFAQFSDFDSMVSVAPKFADLVEIQTQGDLVD